MKSAIEKLSAEVAAVKASQPSNPRPHYPAHLKVSAARTYRGQSELGAGEFAERLGISYTAMKNWLQLTAKRESVGRRPRDKMVEVVFPPPELEVPAAAKPVGTSPVVVIVLASSGSSGQDVGLWSGLVNTLVQSLGR